MRMCPRSGKIFLTILFLLQCGQLQTDLETVLDEKHDLETERDAFKCKAHRLNHELLKALSASKPVDIDSLITENRWVIKSGEFQI